MNESNAGGKFDQIIGKAKQGIGEALGDDKLANEGAAEQVKGHAKEAWGDVKDTASDVQDKANARGTVAAEETHTKTENTGSHLRDEVTAAAERAKESIGRGLDHLKGDHKD